MEKIIREAEGIRFWKKTYFPECRDEDLDEIRIHEIYTIESRGEQCQKQNH